jgi:hypothetical protein
VKMIDWIGWVQEFAPVLTEMFAKVFVTIRLQILYTLPTCLPNRIDIDGRSQLDGTQ